MPRGKTLLDKILDFLFDILEGLGPIYLLTMLYWWFFNRAAFWKWLFYGIGFIAIIIIIAIWRRRTRFKGVQKFLSDRELLQKLRKMHPNEFEEYIADLFSKLGYRTETAGGPYDRGVDVVAEKDGIKYYIQCKKFITQQVGVHDVRDFYGALADHLAQGKGYFITTNIFTLEAEKFAEGKPIELIDGNTLIKYIRMAEEKGVNVERKNKEKICPKCGGKLLEKTGKYGLFYGCANYPKCEYTENILK